jgi:hypothetical protein
MPADAGLARPAKQGRRVACLLLLAQRSDGRWAGLAPRGRGLVDTVRPSSALA